MKYVKEQYNLYTSHDLETDNQIISHQTNQNQRDKC